MNWLQLLLNPPSGLHLGEILLISFILGILHGATPDEHTWPITFSYAVGKYSTRGGMKTGFLFSLGFTAQRALLTTLGYLGLAQIYNQSSTGLYTWRWASPWRPPASTSLKADTSTSPSTSCWEDVDITATRSEESPCTSSRRGTSRWA